MLALSLSKEPALSLSKGWMLEERERLEEGGRRGEGGNGRRELDELKIVPQGLLRRKLSRADP